MREARKKVTVLLSGQGGDELLAGYIPYFLTYLKSAIDNGKYIQGLREMFAGRDLYSKFFFDKLVEQIKSEAKIDIQNIVQKVSENEVNFKSFKNLNERLFQDVTKLTTPSLLRYEDKNSMANSLESRVPFFDHVVVEYIFNLPIDQKIKHGWNRFIYRNAVKGLIPEKNRLRKHDLLLKFVAAESYNYQNQIGLTHIS
jgi:asparagine synthase (glutamine-hydrolysing)